MLKLLSDENFSGKILRGLIREHAELDLIRVQDVGLTGAREAEILRYAGSQGRVLLSHDAATVPAQAHQRVAGGELMSGVFVIRFGMPIGQAIEQILFLSLEAEAGEWTDQVLYLPL